MPFRPGVVCVLFSCFGRASRFRGEAVLRSPAQSGSLESAPRSEREDEDFPSDCVGDGRLGNFRGQRDPLRNDGPLLSQPRGRLRLPGQGKRMIGPKSYNKFCWCPQSCLNAYTGGKRLQKANFYLKPTLIVGSEL